MPLLRKYFQTCNPDVQLLTVGISRGPIETPMLDRLLTGTQSTSSAGTTSTYDALPLGRKGQADEVAKSIAFLLGDESSYMTGHTLSVDGGAAA